MSGAMPRGDISEPPAYPVWWWVERLVDPPPNQDGSLRIIATSVKCRTWFDARAEGTRRLGCEVNEVKIVQGTRTGVTVDGEFMDLEKSTPNPPRVSTPRPSKKRK